VVYDPEDVGLMLWKWMPPNGDFQHLPSWRELVVATALSLRRHHADTLIVPMSLIRDAYRAEILGGLADAGEQVLHVFLEVDAGVLRERLNARVTDPKYTDWEQAARELGMTGVDEMVAAAARQPAGTLLLRSDQLTPAALADKVLAAAGVQRPPLSRPQAHRQSSGSSQRREPEGLDGQDGVTTANAPRSSTSTKHEGPTSPSQARSTPTSRPLKRARTTTVVTRQESSTGPLMARRDQQDPDETGREAGA